MYRRLDGDTGAAVLRTIGEHAGLETVNTTMATFVEFLHHLQILIREDQGVRPALVIGILLQALPYGISPGLRRDIFLTL